MARFKSTSDAIGYIIMWAASLALAILIIAGRAHCEGALPKDPCQRSAYKALRGDYGKLPSWKYDAYIWVIAKRIKVRGLAKVTSYGPWEGCGKYTASGTVAGTHELSANPELPYRTVVWTHWGIRYVEDRGGKVKLSYTRASESANLDYYTLRGIETEHNVPWARVKR